MYCAICAINHEAARCNNRGGGRYGATRAWRFLLTRRVGSDLNYCGLRLAEPVILRPPCDFARNSYRRLAG